MKNILGEAKTIRQLLSGTRYSIDYYQREYKWETKQVRELLEDLTDKFLESHTDNNERSAVEEYGSYFLGSIIISNKKNLSFIIDGQQRLTTLSLLLIYLHNRQGGRSDRVKLEDLIYSEKFGKKTFNIDVEERKSCLEAIYSGNDYDVSDEPESVRNIKARFGDIERLFPDSIDEHGLPYFADWLIENVYLVEITAYSDEDAYTIFETMNDRGLSLNPLEMLKGYLLANIGDEQDRFNANKIWKERINALKDFGKDEDADAFKSWLRGQYSESIRERKKGAQPKDFDRLGTEFHRWVRENREKIGLKVSDDFLHFIERDMSFYTKQFLRLRQASVKMIPGFETVYYNSRFEFTLQYPLMLAAIKPEDDEQTIQRKLRVVSSYVDILIARRLWNFRLIAYSYMQYAMFIVMKDIRHKSLEELVKILKSKLEAEKESFATNDRLRVHQQNRFAIHQILARLTDYVEKQSGMPSHFEEYVSEGKNRYEIEHIWANHFERHRDEFQHEGDFADYRNKIGGLLLLPKSFNASYSDLPYQNKLKHYFSQNILARSLHADCYKRNPGFIGFIKSSGLPFKPHSEFKSADLDERQALYKKIAEELWNPARLEREALS